MGHLKWIKWGKFSQGWVANGAEFLLVLPHFPVDLIIPKWTRIQSQTALNQLSKIWVGFFRPREKYLIIWVIIIKVTVVVWYLENALLSTTSMRLLSTAISRNSRTDVAWESEDTHERMVTAGNIVLGGIPDSDCLQRRGTIGVQTARVNQFDLNKANFSRHFYSVLKNDWQAVHIGSWRDLCSDEIYSNVQILKWGWWRN